VEVINNRNILFLLIHLENSAHCVVMKKPITINTLKETLPEDENYRSDIGKKVNTHLKYKYIIKNSR